MIDGVVTVIITPLDNDRNISKNGLKKLVEYQIESGISAFWALGSTGEDISLPKKTRYEFAEILGKIVNGRIPVIMGNSDFSIEDNLIFYNHCKECGIDNVSYIHRDTKQGMSRVIDVITNLADNSPLPIYLYNNIQRGKEIDYSSLSLLKNHKNIKGVKYGARMHMPFIRASSLNAPNFQVMSAGNFFFSALCYGLSASTTSDANFMPRVYVKIKKLFDKGEIKAARNLQFQAIDLLQKIPRTDNGESSAEIKYLLSKMNYCDENLNQSYRNLNITEKDKLNKIIDEIHLLNKEC